MAALFYAPINGSQEFQFLHILISTCYFLFFGNGHLNKYEVKSHLMFWFPLDIELEAEQFLVSQCVFLLDVVGLGYQCVEWMLEIHSIKRWKKQSQKIKMEVKCWVTYFVLFSAIYPKTFWLRIVRLLAIPNTIVGFKKVNFYFFFFLMCLEKTPWFYCFPASLCLVE